MTVYGYTRVSTGGQDVAGQLLALERWRAGDGRQVEVMLSDEGVSSRKRRPQLERLLSVVVRGDVVVVAAFDRLARSTRELLELCEAFEKAGVTLISLREGVDTATPVGRMIRTMLAAVAEFERELVSERTKAGLTAAVARGAKPGRPALVSADAVARALELRSEGLTLRAVAARLEAEGVPAPAGGRWHNESVRRALRMAS